MSGVWIYIEQANGDLAGVSRELLGKGLELADALNQPLAALAIGQGSATLAQRAFDFGANKAYIVDNAAVASYTTDGYVTAAVALFREYQPELLLTSADPLLRDFTAALAAELSVELAVEATDVNIENGQISATCSSHGGNESNTLVLNAARPAIIAVREHSFTEAKQQGARSGEVITGTLPASAVRTTTQIL